MKYSLSPLHICDSLDGQKINNITIKIIDISVIPNPNIKLALYRNLSNINATLMPLVIVWI